MASTMQWESLPEMDVPRQDHGMAAINGKLCVTGGKCEVLDLATMQWESLPQMKTARRNHGMAAMDGKLYVTGGRIGRKSKNYLKTGEVLDLATMQWESLPQMKIARIHHGMAAMDGKLYVTGGTNGSSAETGEVLDLVTMQWEWLPQMNAPRHNHGMAAMDSELYVIGGNCPKATGEVLKLLKPSLRIPHDAALQQIADAHSERVAKVKQEKAATCNATRREIEVLEAKLAEQMHLLNKQTAEFDQVLETVCAEAAEAAAKAESFAARVVSTGLDELNIDDVYELLHRLQVKVSKSVLQKEDLNGVALAVLTETDMEQVLNMSKLGDRRKLSVTLQRLGNQQGFAPGVDASAPGALGWDTQKVCDWLSSEGFEQCTDNFRDHRIDGLVLLKLTPDDLRLLGLSTIRAKTQFVKKLDVVKKQTYAGQVIGESSFAAAPAPSAPPAPRLTEDQRRLVLEQVLEENAALQEQLSQRHPRRDEMPDHFMCPITNEVMEDPVFAMDGFTYEQSAISTWFQRHNTSPMTRAVIPPTLVPNAGKRSEIANWK